MRRVLRLALALAIVSAISGIAVSEFGRIRCGWPDGMILVTLDGKPFFIDRSSPTPAASRHRIPLTVDQAGLCTSYDDVGTALGGSGVVLLLLSGVPLTFLRMAEMSKTRYPQ